VCSRGHNWEATTTGLLLATTWRYADVALATNFSPLISCSHVTMMIPIRGPQEYAYRNRIKMKLGYDVKYVFYFHNEMSYVSRREY
jgi:hypothetical protein